MNILHTSDWHLGQFFQKSQNRQKEHAKFIDWLLAQVTQYQIDAVIVTGDIFDQAVPPSYARQLYAIFIRGMYERRCQLVIVAGNYDAVATLEESQPLMKLLGVHVQADVDMAHPEKQVKVLKNRVGEPGALVCVLYLILGPKVYIAVKQTNHWMIKNRRCSSALQIIMRRS